MSGFPELLVLLGIGIAAGLVSTIASLASVVSYPALLALGLPPVSANVTNTVALMFTGLGAAAGSRPELAGQGRVVRQLGVLTAAGGATGAALLLLTPAPDFVRAAPVLIAIGSVVILRPPRRAAAGAGGTVSVAEGSVGAAATEGEQAGTVAPPVAETDAGAIAPERDAAGESAGPAVAGGWAGRAGVFTVAIYTGYFGAAGGILMLALLLRMLGQPLARTNAVKNVISGLANAVAGLGFAFFGPVRWLAVVPLAAGFLIGGWTGPKIVRRLPATGLRVLISLGGLALAIHLGLDAY